MDGETAKFIVEQINTLRGEFKAEIRALGDRLAPVEKSYWKMTAISAGLIVLADIGFKVYEAAAK